MSSLLNQPRDFQTLAAHRLVSVAPATWLADLSALDSGDCRRTFDAAAQDWELAALHAHRAIERQARYVQSHGGLRIVLADVVGCAPDTIVLIRDQSGRMAMRDGPGVSISYADDRCAVAISTSGPVGIDFVHLAGADLPLAPSFCSEREMHAVAEVLGQEIRRDLAVWAAKEAAAKLTGDVRLEPEEWTVYAATDGVQVRSSCHPVIHIAFHFLAPHYLAAIARHDPPISLPFNWSAR